jgi:hypothetical protein
MERTADGRGQSALRDAVLKRRGGLLDEVAVDELEATLFWLCGPVGEGERPWERGRCAHEVSLCQPLEACSLAH